MRKWKTLLTVCLAAAVGMSASLMGCSATENVTVEEHELSCYRGEKEKSDGSILYNTALFYDNAVQQGYPDPQVLDDTARSGYYYLYGTSDGFSAMRSKNLTEWENVGPVFNHAQSDEVKRCTNKNTWAPEVIYDKDYDNGTYFLFFSSTPVADETVNSKAVGITTVGPYNMYVATSKSPEGPFVMVNFEDKHNLNTQTGVELTEEQATSGDYAYVRKTENNVVKYYEAAYPHYFAKYCLFSPDELSKVMTKNGVPTSMTIEKPDAQYWGCIDPHPFVDPETGEKYMYFKSEPDRAQWNIILYVKMTDWLTPDWSVADYALINGYYTIADWRAGVNKGVSYEDTTCNEGPFVLYNEDSGKYYLTYSANAYGTSSYQVGMAVGDSPKGPFRKLTEAEGGLLLCSSGTGSNSISGAGHHSFMTLGDQLFIVYHRHKDFFAGGGERYTAVDEIKWITVEDKDGNDLVVPYVNGPTDSIQPQPDAVSGYTNVAGEATVTADGAAENLGALTDGLLAVHKEWGGIDEVFLSYIPQTSITKTTTFTFDFKSARNARAVMVYNSTEEDSIFRKISKIEFTLADGSTRVVRNVKFDLDKYCELGGQSGDVIQYVKTGAAAFIEFYDIDVKTIKITVDVPKDQSRVTLSEIRILGKSAA